MNGSLALLIRKVQARSTTEPQVARHENGTVFWGAEQTNQAGPVPGANNVSRFPCGRKGPGNIW